MIFVGIDDTDVEGSRGTNQLARLLVSTLSPDFRCQRIVRHQLLVDPRVPCTTKNGSASIMLEPLVEVSISDLAVQLRDTMIAQFVAGSDPGLCVTPSVPASVVEWGRRCKVEFVCQSDARELAHRHDIYLQGLGGSCDGMIGALAAVGLAATADDGRIVQLAQWPDDVSGVQSIELLRARGLQIRCHETGDLVGSGLVDVGKRLRPNRCRGEDVLFVKQTADASQDFMKALKLP